MKSSSPHQSLSQKGQWLSFVFLTAILTSDCGDTSVQNQPSGSDNGAANRTTISGTADWTQTQQRVPCGSISNSNCDDSLKLTIDSNGKMAVAHNGQIMVQGNLTNSQLVDLNRRIKAAAYRDVERKPIQCVPEREQDQQQGPEEVDIIMPQSPELRVYDHKPQQHQVCFRGALAQAQALNVYLRTILQYYLSASTAPHQPQPSPWLPPPPVPTPIPAPAATPSPAATPIVAPTPGPSRRVGSIPTGVWGGSHAAMTVNDDNVVFQFDCAHGEATAPIPTNENGRFEFVGTIHLDNNTLPATDRASLQARYSGRITSNQININIYYSYGTTPHSESYTLNQGQEGTTSSCP